MFCLLNTNSKKNGQKLPFTFEFDLSPTWEQIYITVLRILFIIFRKKIALETEKTVRLDFVEKNPGSLLKESKTDTEKCPFYE